MVMKDYEYFKAEEKLLKTVYYYEAVIKLKEGLVALLDNQLGTEHAKIKKRYAKEIQKLQELLNSTNTELATLQSERGGEEENKEPLPDYILEMSTKTVLDIEDFNKHNETLMKVRTQIKELEKEITKIRKLTPEQIAELEGFLMQLETVKSGLVAEVDSLEKIVNELDNMALRGVGNLIDAIDGYEKGCTLPKQMQ